MKSNLQFFAQSFSASHGLIQIYKLTERRHLGLAKNNRVLTLRRDTLAGNAILSELYCLKGMHLKMKEFAFVGQNSFLKHTRF